jgi:hypothetical protein
MEDNNVLAKDTGLKSLDEHETTSLRPPRRPQCNFRTYVVYRVEHERLTTSDVDVGTREWNNGIGFFAGLNKLSLISALSNSVVQSYNSLTRHSGWPHCGGGDVEQMAKVKNEIGLVGSGTWPHRLHGPKPED